MAEHMSPFMLAGEHLVDFIDKILEAFQTGGRRDAEREPLTLDVARRIIWSEVRRTVQRLSENSDQWGGERCLWLRIEGKTADEILAVCAEMLDKVWAFRAYGPRGQSDTTVIYAVAQPVVGSEEARQILERLTTRGLSVRDFTLGVYPY